MDGNKKGEVGGLAAGGAAAMRPLHSHERRCPSGRIDDRHLSSLNLQVNHDPVVRFIGLPNQVVGIGGGHERIGAVCQPGNINGLAGQIVLIDIRPSHRKTLANRRAAGEAGSVNSVRLRAPADVSQAVTDFATRGYHLV